MAVNIVLTGLMGAGKSSVGKLISEKFENYSFIDIDEEIVKREGMSISDIFHNKSELYFRELEQKIIEEYSELSNYVISIGGGAFENEQNRTNLSKNGKTFYLKASAETLYSHIKNDKTRPLLQCENPLKKLKELLNKREPNYLKSDFVIDTDNKNIEDICGEIYRLLSL